MGYYCNSRKEGKSNIMNLDEPTIKGLREITVDVIDKEISVPAMVVRSSEVVPMGTKIVYRCECGQLNEGKVDGLVNKAPKKCNKCGNTELQIDAINCEFVDYQKVRLQELPEDLPAG